MAAGVVRQAQTVALCLFYGSVAFAMLLVVRGRWHARGRRGEAAAEAEEEMEALHMC